MARRVAASMASRLSFDEISAGNVALVVTEAAKNLLKHAGGGQVILRVLEAGASAGIEILALDKGPGISDLGRSFQDGFSTAGTTGTGLGAIARLSTTYGVYSRPGQGTMLTVQIWNRGTPPAASARFEAGGVSLPMQGETECGDSWVFQYSPRGARVVMADGLGHGPLAAQASMAAITASGLREGDPLPYTMEQIHSALRPTRGAAVAIAEIDPAAKVVRFSGVGNIGATIVSASAPLRRMVSLPGTVGHQIRKIMEYTYPWDPGACLVMHSDGLQSHWSFDPYPGLIERPPSVVAGVLYRDFARGRDDVTVAVVREAKTKS